MSTPTPAHPVTPSKAKKKSKDQDKDKDRETKEKAQLPGERLKVVVRRLPPNLPEDIFWQSVSNWVTEESVSWKAYYSGKPRKRANKENVPSRAYIAFKTPDHLLVFGREYDGHKFVDKAGNESYAVVEYAPYQKVPGEKKKPDSRHATIKKDEDYISFIESLKAPSTTEPVSIETLIASTRPPSPPKTTPLLEALKVEKQAQKDKEAIIRNHAHYKDLLKGSSAKEEKRKAARAAEAAVAAGKKGKKGGVPLPPKPVQIQAKPSAASAPAQKGNTPSAKPQPSPARPGRKHGAKASKEANPAPPNAAATPAAAPKDAVRAPTPTAAPAPPKPATPAQPPAQDTTPAPAAPAPARRGRPVLGLGSRHFEAALSGVGVTGDRKRREKGKEAAPANLATPRENASQEKPNPPTSPKRSRHQKGNPASAATGPDANGASVLAVPAGAQVEGGAPPPYVNGGRGGKRGGRGGRGRGGPPRVG
ncbi:Regulator of nonsense transcripts UPF3 [Leucoagaricus sp. SymC.cos]|nr:Regulator of nonsense transcripts UPF3 [Leucoagaricus sp. SymC.cos]